MFMEDGRELNMKNMVPMIVVVVLVAVAGVGIYRTYRDAHLGNSQTTAAATNGPTTGGHARFDQ